MKKLLFIGLAIMTSASAFAAETCYQLSSDPQLWSRTAELLCVNEPAGDIKQTTITLKINELGRDQIIAKFNLDLLYRARCMDCNSDKYGISNPSNSIFNALSITFDGTRTFGGSEYSESGTVLIGTNNFYYKKH